MVNVVRQGSLGATRTCPHCKAVVLQSANVCPGCQHHLRFNVANSEPQAAGHYQRCGIERTFHRPRPRPCRYCVVVSITNEQGEKIARHVVGVGALSAGERHKYSFSVEVIPARGSERASATQER